MVVFRDSRKPLPHSVFVSSAHNLKCTFQVVNLLLSIVCQTCHFSCLFTLHENKESIVGCEHDEYLCNVKIDKKKNLPLTFGAALHSSWRSSGYCQFPSRVPTYEAHHPSLSTTKQYIP